MSSTFASRSAYWRKLFSVRKLRVRAASLEVVELCPMLVALAFLMLFWMSMMRDAFSHGLHLTLARIAS